MLHSLLKRLSGPQLRPLGKSGPDGEHTVQVKRPREPACQADGLRVLVERTWPRGNARERLVIRNTRVH